VNNWNIFTDDMLLLKSEQPTVFKHWTLEFTLCCLLQLSTQNVLSLVLLLC